MIDRKKKLAFGALGAAALFGFGAAVGAGGSSAEAEPQPVPTVTATATVTSPPKTVEKVVEKTPAACLQYVTLSEQGFSYAGEAMGYMSEAMIAASTFDVAGMKSANGKLDTVTPKMKALAPESNAAKAACKAAG